MISVDQAREAILSRCKSLQAVQRPLSKAHGQILAADVYAPVSIPAYRQSSMDGYAFAFGDWKTEKALDISGESAAGTALKFPLASGHAMRIFTGAPVPDGADTVVMQEKTRTENLRLYITDSNIHPGDHVREIGSEIRRGELALKAGSLLTPAAVGFLAGLGIAEVSLYPRPTIALILTGNELIEPGQVLGAGQVYEANSYSLEAALQREGLTLKTVLHVKDDPEQLREVLREMIIKHEVVLLTGGVSVGDYDYVPKVAGLCGVETVFHRVRQKPGKPLFFGISTHDPQIPGSPLNPYTYVFGLPGNPSSVLNCYYQFVLPGLRLMQHKMAWLTSIQARTRNGWRKPAGITHFLKGIYHDGQVEILDAQESYRLSSFALANCLVEIAEEKENLETGELVKAWLLS